MAEIGERLEDVAAICISHAHTDHVSSLARVMKERIRRGRALPAYLTQATSTLIDWDGLECPPVKYFEPGKAFEIGELRISPWTVPHDCLQPVGFVVESNHAKIGIATDLGYVPDSLRFKFRDVDALLIESNHDLDMLMAGPHPMNVKVRVAGKFGHLSNSDTEEYLRTDLGPGVRHVVLGHLSRTCNLQGAVFERAQEALLQRGSAASLTIAEQDKRTELITI
jgi:phosphoribosyl 1,2-cyclic phosphodiesterase